MHPQPWRLSGNQDSRWRGKPGNRTRLMPGMRCREPLGTDPAGSNFVTKFFCPHRFPLFSAQPCEAALPQGQTITAIVSNTKTVRKHVAKPFPPLQAADHTTMVNQSLKIYAIIRHNKAQMRAHTLNNLRIFLKRRGSGSLPGCQVTRQTPTRRAVNSNTGTSDA